MDKKILPVGVAAFANIRKDNSYYVDKTPLIIDLLTTSRCVFLSRPRRFGKSLTLDTIAKLFAGQKDLFTGLYAEHHWDWEQTHPVIRLSFANEPEQYNINQLRSRIVTKLRRNADVLGVELDEEKLSHDVGDAFGDLIFKAHQHYQQQVVVLIDEYDKPLIDNLSDKAIALEIRGILKSLYSQLKDLEEIIRFAMITSVSKFGQMSVFSGLNHIDDITLESRYSALCGYTQEELETVFAPELVGVDLEKLKLWYNGYNWNGESVYNPFDILLFFKKGRDFDNYWFQTGGNNSFVMHLVEKEGFDLTTISQQTIGVSFLMNSMDIGQLAPLPVLFQTGYLTIDEKIILDDGVKYRLKYPNLEVRQSFNRSFVDYITGGNQESKRDALKGALKVGDMTSIQEQVKLLFDCIPSDVYRKNNIAHYEGHWASVFFAFFMGCCRHIRLEEPTSQGRIDMVVEEQDYVYLFEFKMTHSGSAQSALQQIRDKRYADKYRATGRQIVEVGVSFDEESRTLEFAV